MAFGIRNELRGGFDPYSFYGKDRKKGPNLTTEEYAYLANPIQRAEYLQSRNPEYITQVKEANRPPLKVPKPLKQRDKPQRMPYKVGKISNREWLIHEANKRQPWMTSARGLMQSQERQRIANQILNSRVRVDKMNKRELQNTLSTMSRRLSGGGAHGTLGDPNSMRRQMQYREMMMGNRSIAHALGAPRRSNSRRRFS